jgi:hypothetical protein
MMRARVRARSTRISPASRLCAQYGISGRGLKKICDRLEVPCPPRGHWARLAAGQSVKQPPLPKASPGTPLEVTITPTPASSPTEPAPELDQETAEKLNGARAAAAHIGVSKTLHSPHWAIAAWIKKHEQQIEADKRDRWRWGSDAATIHAAFRRMKAPSRPRWQEWRDCPF